MNKDVAYGSYEYIDVVNVGVGGEALLVCYHPGELSSGKKRKFRDRGVSCLDLNKRVAHRETLTAVKRNKLD